MRQKRRVKLISEDGVRTTQRDRQVSLLVDGIRPLRRTCFQGFWDAKKQNYIINIKSLFILNLIIKNRFFHVAWLSTFFTPKMCHIFKTQLYKIQTKIVSIEQLFHLVTVYFVTLSNDEA